MYPQKFHDENEFNAFGLYHTQSLGFDEIATESMIPFFENSDQVSSPSSPISNDIEVNQDHINDMMPENMVPEVDAQTEEVFEIEMAPDTDLPDDGFVESLFRSSDEDNPSSEPVLDEQVQINDLVTPMNIDTTNYDDQNQVFPVYPGFQLVVQEQETGTAFLYGIYLDGSDRTLSQEEINAVAEALVRDEAYFLILKSSQNCRSRLLGTLVLTCTELLFNPHAIHVTSPAMRILHECLRFCNEHRSNFHNQRGRLYNLFNLLWSVISGIREQGIDPNLDTISPFLVDHILLVPPNIQSENGPQGPSDQGEGSTSVLNPPLHTANHVFEQSTVEFTEGESTSNQETYVSSVIFPDEEEHSETSNSENELEDDMDTEDDPFLPENQVSEAQNLSLGNETTSSAPNYNDAPGQNTVNVLNLRLRESLNLISRAIEESTGTD